MFQKSFAYEPLVSRPSLKRLVLHGEHVHDIFVKLVTILDLDLIPKIILCNLASSRFSSEFLRNTSPPTAELSVVNCNGGSSMEIPVWGSRAHYHFCVDDGLGNFRVLHSKHFDDCYPVMDIFTTVNINMSAFVQNRHGTLPLLTTLRLRASAETLHFTKFGREAPLSCPALVHLELYFVQPRPRSSSDRYEKDLTAPHLLECVRKNLIDFKTPLQTLRVVGAHMGDDVGVLNNMACAVFFTHSPLIECVIFLFCCFDSRNPSETTPCLLLHSQIHCSRGYRSWSIMKRRESVEEILFDPISLLQPERETTQRLRNSCERHVYRRVLKYRIILSTHLVGLVPHHRSGLIVRCLGLLLPRTIERQMVILEPSGLFTNGIGLPFRVVRRAGCLKVTMTTSAWILLDCSLAWPSLAITYSAFTLTYEFDIVFNKNLPLPSFLMHLKG